MRAPFTPFGEATPHFMALLMLGRERGYLSPDDVMEVLEGVELTPELISAVIGRVTAEGIEWRDSGEILSDEGLDKLAAEVVRDPHWSARGTSTTDKLKSNGDAVAAEDESPRIGTEIVWLVWPGAKVRTPETGV